MPFIVCSKCSRKLELPVISDVIANQFYKDHDCKSNELQAAMQRVRDLHKKIHHYVAGCSEPGCCGDTVDEYLCEECWTDYPCPTIKALDGEE